MVDDAPIELREALEPVATCEERADQQTTGYVVHTFQTALWEWLSAESAEEAIVRAVTQNVGRA